MMLTANQLYKQSNSSLSFKEWLKENQQKGLLDDHEKMFNLIEGEVDEDEEDKTPVSVPKKATTQKAVTKLSMVNIVGLIGIAVLIYGLSKTSAE
jgi:hypothetical protein